MPFFFLPLITVPPLLFFLTLALASFTLFDFTSCHLMVEVSPRATELTTGSISNHHKLNLWWKLLHSTNSEREQDHQAAKSSARCSTASMHSLTSSKLDASHDDAPQNRRSLLMALMSSNYHTKPLTQTHSETRLMHATHTHTHTHTHVIPHRCMAWWGARYRDRLQIWTLRLSSVWHDNSCRGWKTEEDASLTQVCAVRMCGSRDQRKMATSQQTDISCQHLYRMCCSVYMLLSCMRYL